MIIGTALELLPGCTDGCLVREPIEPRRPSRFVR